MPGRGWDGKSSTSVCPVGKTRVAATSSRIRRATDRVEPGVARPAGSNWEKHTGSDKTSSQATRPPAAQMRPLHLDQNFTDRPPCSRRPRIRRQTDAPGRKYNHPGIPSIIRQGGVTVNQDGGNSMRRIGVDCGCLLPHARTGTPGVNPGATGPTRRRRVRSAPPSESGAAANILGQAETAGRPRPAPDHWACHFELVRHFERSEKP